MNEKAQIKKPELLAPAGNWAMLNTAIKSGANAIYFGVKQLNMRAAAGNFDISELDEIVKVCAERNVKAHLTLNTIVYENELGELDEIIRAAKQAGIELIICWDMSVIQKCMEHQVPFCISTQASISNSASIKFYENLGASRVVLARECTLDKIRDIKSKSKIEIETFVHGAMCVAVSGRCFMSHELFGKSANRGECLQPCRREFEVIDKDQSGSLVLGEDYIMSPKDLCTIEILDKLIEAGIDSFKIEGRKRAPEYIAKVVSTYRQAIDLYFDGKLTLEIKKQFVEELQKVYNRGFSTGFYLGIPSTKDFANIYGSAATTKKSYVGKVVNYYKKSNVVSVKLEADAMSVGETIYIIGNTTGTIELKIDRLMLDEKELTTSEKGTEITFKCSQLVRPNDRIYKIVTVEA
ncbi:MAG: peptidase U32 family protein [Ignavibacteria bacterium]|nr:peptidase U32 family protein [Ignavibacteria bacterium]